MLREIDAGPQQPDLGAGVLPIEHLHAGAAAVAQELDRPGIARREADEFWLVLGLISRSLEQDRDAGPIARESAEQLAELGIAALQRIVAAGEEQVVADEGRILEARDGGLGRTLEPGRGVLVRGARQEAQARRAEDLGMLPEAAARQDEVAAVRGTGVVERRDLVEVGIVVVARVGHVLAAPPAGEIEEGAGQEVRRLRPAEEGAGLAVPRRDHAPADQGRARQGRPARPPRLLVVAGAGPQRAGLDVALGVGREEAFVLVEMKDRLEAARQLGRIDGHGVLLKPTSRGAAPPPPPAGLPLKPTSRAAARRPRRAGLPPQAVPARRTSAIRRGSQSRPDRQPTISVQQDEPNNAAKRGSLSGGKPTSRSQAHQSARSVFISGPSIRPERHKSANSLQTLAKRSRVSGPFAAMARRRLSSAPLKPEASRFAQSGWAASASPRP